MQEKQEKINLLKKIVDNTGTRKLIDSFLTDATYLIGITIPTVDLRGRKEELDQLFYKATQDILDSIYEELEPTYSLKELKHLERIFQDETFIKFNNHWKKDDASLNMIGQIAKLRAKALITEIDKAFPQKITKQTKEPNTPSTMN